MSTGFHELRIDLQDWKNETKYAAYQIFSIDFENRYRLKVMGCSGSAGSFHTVNIYVLGKNKFYNRCPMQTEKSQPEGKRIMPETRLTRELESGIIRLALGWVF